MARKRARRGRPAGSDEAGQDLAIQTHRLTKAYGELVAVDNLNLSIRTGEVLASSARTGRARPRRS